MLQAVSDCLQDLLKCTSKDMSVCSRLTCRSTARAARLRSRSHMFVLMSSAAAEPEHNASNIRNCHACLCGVTRMIIKGTCAMQTGQCDQLRLHATMESLAKTQHLSTEYGTKCNSSSDFARHRDCPVQACMYIDERLSEGTMSCLSYMLAFHVANSRLRSFALIYPSSAFFSGGT